jgi:predicted dehydrogenase
VEKRWKVGVLGLGHWYSAYQVGRALAEDPRARLVAVTCPEADKRDAYATTFGIDGYASTDELLDRANVDVVHICPPVAQIPDDTIKAARAGKHLVLGKPMAMTVAQADAIVAAVREAGVVCMPFQGSYRLAAAGLKRRLQEGLIGDVVVMHATGRWGIAEDWFRSGRPGWFADPTRVPGGAFIDEGIYSIEQLRWLAGSEVVQVEAKMANLVHRDLQVEDWGFATFTYANGVVATLEASWTINAPQKTGPSPKHNGVIRLEVIGTRGEAIQDSLRGPGWSILAADSPHWVFERDAAEFSTPPSAGPLNHLLDCLETGHPPVASIEDARAAFVVALAAYESARSGRPVRI